MNCGELFIFVSVVTAVSFFSSITGIGKRSMQASFQLFGSHEPFSSHEPAVESEYKSPVYKLWQYVIKNKPSTHNGNAVYFNTKQYPHIQRFFVSQCSPERLRQSESYAKQSTSIESQKRLSFENNLSFHEYDDHSGIGWRNVFGSVLHIYLTNRILVYVKNVFGRGQVCGRKEYSELNNLTSRIHKNTVWQQSEKPHRIYAHANRVFYHQVYCL
ncbi:hypothetical protein V3564_05795 [Bartonella sp. B12(2025)]